MFSSSHVDNSKGYLEICIAPMMAGKCFAKDTLLLKSDGSSVKVQELKLGDKLMGDDGKSSRTVLLTTRGKGRLFTIFSDYSEPLTVNEDHILVLKTVVKVGEQPKIFEITVKDYLDTPVRKAKNYRIFTSEYDLPYQTNLEKYPVLESCYKAGTQAFDDPPRWKIDNFSFFLNNALRVRRYFFAGILDKYSTPHPQPSIRMDIISPSRKEWVLQLARSLGFYVNIVEERMCFYGNFTLLPCSNTVFTNLCDDIVHTGCRFWIESAGMEEQDYYGFMVDENSRFLTADCFIAHNTTEILRKLSTISRTKKCLYLNHDSDTRSESDFSTHNPLFKTQIPNIDMKRVPMLSCSSVLTILEQYAIVAIDEAQFFPDLIESVKLFVEDYGKYVIVAGLSGDVNRKPFGQILNLIPFADQVHMLSSFCENCARDDKTTPAPFTILRKSVSVPNETNTDGNIVQIGGAESYEPVCRECYILNSKNF